MAQEAAVATPALCSGLAAMAGPHSPVGVCVTQGLTAPVKGTQNRKGANHLCAPLRADSGPAAGTVVVTRG